MVAFCYFTINAYTTSTPTMESFTMKEAQNSWAPLIGPHQSGQVSLHSGLRDEELLLGVHSRMLSLGWSDIPTSCLTLVFPALGAAHFLYLEP